MIVFHSPDSDGWFSGALVKKFLHPEGQLTYANYNQDEEAVRRILAAKPKKLYVVDYSFKPEVFDQIIDACGEVFWYDHHETAIQGASEKMKALQGHRESGRSAAWWVWKDCEEKSESLDTLVKFVSDYDTFSFDDNHPLDCEAPCFNAWISFDRGGALDQLNRAWNLIEELYDWEDDEDAGDYLMGLVDIGHTYLSNELNNAKSASKRAVFGSYDDMRFAAINSANLNPAYVCKPHQVNCAFVFCWYMLNDGKIKMDIRSDKFCGADVSRIAKLLGGGGHEHAAGCTVTLDTFLKIMEKRE